MSPSGQPRNFNEKLEARGETLYHQVHPLQVAEDGLPWVKSFMPNSTDDDLMSTRRESIGGKRAYDEYVAMTDDDGKPLESIGSWAFTVGDVLDSSLVVFDDAGLDDQPEGHASVDFRDLGSKTAYKAGKALRNAAFNNTLNLGN
jgi:hypothetical protein